MVALKSSGECVLDSWLPIYSMKEPFLAMATTWRQQNERQVFQMYSTISQSHSAAVNGHRESILVWGFTLSLACKTPQIEKSSGF